ncbi:hypothetical protein [Bifidobacterium cuniculi]|uniref:hypothetical protein n=1 Tax=Bifidobacterium cuniculi TaxID=1688 RepID=UPI001269BDC3|nr:hypothetical protein [Bifidobacterium cuniculi]
MFCTIEVQVAVFGVVLGAQFLGRQVRVLRQCVAAQGGEGVVQVQVAGEVPHGWMFLSVGLSGSP